MRLLELYPAVNEADITDEEIAQRMQSVRQHCKSALDLIHAVLQDPKIPWEHRTKIADVSSVLETINIECDLSRPRVFK